MLQEANTNGSWASELASTCVLHFVYLFICPSSIQRLLYATDRNPGPSVRALAAVTIAASSTVWSIMHNEGLQPFHLQRVQVLQVQDYPRHVAFTQWCLQKSVTDRLLQCSVLFTDEASFTHNTTYGQYSQHLRPLDNTHGTRPGAAQHRFAVNEGVSCGVHQGDAHDRKRNSNGGEMLKREAHPSIGMDKNRFEGDGEGVWD
ncbi:uncharacterized protein CDAR_592601 [Caerostris darwini]|uniref:Uncharacterized protein n=1 Tax=Caerostris darwini TaxID=1538125 RepID=A0AAV4QJQ0_9ARAC|nr:uncharacterized protein CDAR_592601 [Caerostris darwini]